MTDLSAEDRAAIQTIGLRSGHFSPDDYIYGDRCYEAGKAAGIAQGMEKAARICHNSIQLQGPYFATAIRAAAKGK